MTSAIRLMIVTSVIGLSVAWFGSRSAQRVGDHLPEGTVIPFGQPVKSEGKTVLMPYRPIQVQILNDGSGVIVLHNRGVSIYDLPTLSLRQVLPVQEGSSFEGGTSMTGLAQSKDGRYVAVSGSHSTVFIAELRNQNLSWKNKLVLPAPKVKGYAYPCGMSWTKDDKQLLICASRSNQLLEYSTVDWSLAKAYDVDPAPFEVDASIPGKACVTCWSRTPNLGEEVADASGTSVPVDKRGIAVEGSIDKVDLKTGNIAKIPCGRQPSNLVRMDSGYLVPCANDDEYITLSDSGLLAKWSLAEQFGKQCSPTWAARSMQTGEVAIALGRANQIALFRKENETFRFERALSTMWYPASIASFNAGWIVACSEGVGSRAGADGDPKRTVSQFSGSLSVVPFSAKSASLPTHETGLPPRQRRKPVPVPERLGEPTVFHHIVYVLKENRTYDQILGDLKQAEGDANLCDYPRRVTPNQHKLAEDFVILDNYYCNGIISSDGHAWAMEGNATSYFEKSFGGWTRSYPYGDDPLSVSSTGYIWDDVLAHGKTFRNYGEFDYAGLKPGDSWEKLFADFRNNKLGDRFTQSIGVKQLKKYTRAGYPGWNLNIPDVIRADIFLKDLMGNVPLADFTIIYLPQDHTAGDTHDEPTPAACVADNDLALGKIVEGISHSKYWKDTCIFANEDDPQDGYDHIDGHRSICLVASAYTKRNEVNSRFYNQTSVLRTIEHILNIPPMNRVDAESPLMTSCFNERPDFRPYTAIPNQIPLDQMNQGRGHRLALQKPDLNNDRILNRILWKTVHPGKAYPMASKTKLLDRGLILGTISSSDND